MKILLVEPPFHSFMHYDRWYYPTSLAQLAAVAHAANHEVYIYDGDKYFYKDLATRERGYFITKQHLYYDNVDNYGHYIWQHFRQVLKDINPEVVGVSVYTCKLKSAFNTLKLVHEFNAGAKICVGGVHVTAAPEAFVSENYIDGIFVGYADRSFPKWLADGCPRGIIKADISKLDFEKLPYVRRQSLLASEYYTSRDLSHILMSRGCVGRCTFCFNSFIWCGRPIFRTPESIRAELTEMLSDWNVKDVDVGDASFSDTPKESKDTARILKDFGVSWSVSVRWSTVNKELLEYFIDCGCKKIFVGLESGSDKILKYMKKGCTKSMVKEKSRLINSLGIDWQLHVIVGFPIETIEDMQETMEFVLEIAPTSIALNSLSPLPGTQVYNDIPGMTLELASEVNQLFPNHCFSRHMDIETYKGMFLRMTETFDNYNKTKANPLTII